MKNFLAITYRIEQNKVVLIATSKGFTLSNKDGLTFDAIIDFLFGLLQYKENKDTVFCTYASALDNEFIFSSLPTEIKDKLFQSVSFKKQLSTLENEQEKLKDVFYSNTANEQEKEESDFNLYVNKLAITDLLEITHKDYKIKLINGKSLRISKKGKAITIYDIYGFFRKPLEESLKLWQIPLPFTISTKTEGCELRSHLITVSKSITLLGNKLAQALAENGINLRHFHGASCVSSWLLSKIEAKKEFHNYKNLRTNPSELSKAMLQAFQSPRAEQLKLGTVNDVNVFDINSAYAFACLDLPVFLRKPVFTTDYIESKFALWFCEFDFTSLSDRLYFGILPFRDKRTNQSGWFLRGAGYYWNSEIEYVLKYYPECISIKHGFYLPNYERAEFTKAINALHNTRRELERNNHPLSAVIKWGLAAIYGKFCQHNGKGYYVNYFYAGFILSKIRTMLLEATRNFEQSTICFLTDAIHTTANLPVEISDEIGKYKVERYDKVTYLDNGIYQCYKSGEIVKTATKGYKTLDFEKMVKELNEKTFFEAEQKLFITHNLHELSPVTFKDYLSVFAFKKTESALKEKRFRMREFEQKKIDLGKEHLDSNILRGYETESGLYKIADFKESDILLDALIANRI